MQEFEAAVDAEQSDDQPIGVDIDELSAEEHGKVYAYRPADGQLALLLASQGRGMAVTDTIAAIVNFFLSLFEGDDRFYIEERLLSRTRNIELERMQEIVEELSEKWSARPTQPPSDSRTSPANGGLNSTRTTRASTF